MAKLVRKLTRLTVVGERVSESSGDSVAPPYSRAEILTRAASQRGMSLVALTDR